MGAPCLTQSGIECSQKAPSQTSCQTSSASFALLPSPNPHLRMPTDSVSCKLVWWQRSLTCSSFLAHGSTPRLHLPVEMRCARSWYIASAGLRLVCCTKLCGS